VYEIIILLTGRKNATIRKTFENETSIEIPDKTETFCQEQSMHILRGFSTSYFPNLVEVNGNLVSISAEKCLELNVGSTSAWEHQRISYAN